MFAIGWASWDAPEWEYVGVAEDGWNQPVTGSQAALARMGPLHLPLWAADTRMTEQVANARPQRLASVTTSWRHGV